MRICGRRHARMGDSPLPLPRLTNRDKDLLHVEPRLGAGVHEDDAVLLCVLLGLIRLYGSLAHDVGLRDARRRAGERSISPVVRGSPFASPRAGKSTQRTGTRRRGSFVCGLLRCHHTTLLSARALALLPASAITTLGSPLLCSSFTQLFAPSKESRLVTSKTTTAALAPRRRACRGLRAR